MALSDDRERVRLLIGDTEPSDPLLYDDELDSHLGARSVVTTTGGTIHNVIAAAADACESIAAKFARDYSFTEDGQSFDRAQRVNHYRALGDSLRRRQGGQSVPLRPGGTISI